MNRLRKNILFIVLLSVLSSNTMCNVLRFEPVNIDKYTSSFEFYPEKRTNIKQTSKVKNVLSVLGKAAKATAEFGFKNYDKILSKKFAAALIIVGAPYLYFSDTALELATRHVADFALKMSSAVTDGVINACVDNKMALAKLMTIMTASQTGQKFAEKAGIKLAEILLTAVTLGRYVA